MSGINNIFLLEYLFLIEFNLILFWPKKYEIHNKNKDKINIYVIGNITNITPIVIFTIYQDLLDVIIMTLGL